MPYINAIETIVPEHRVDQDTAREFAGRHYGARVPDIDRLLTVFDNAGISTRYFSTPLDWFGAPHSLSERNRLYINNATELCCRAAAGLLKRESLEPSQIDYLIYVNTTGLATPSIDARIINRLRLRSNVRRTPIWGLGCAGGAAGLSHAYHHALGHPGERVLVVAAELCGLTFLADDFSKSNLVASALFAEGAAAVLVTGDNVSEGGVEIIDSRSTFYPDSLDVMGWNVVDRGLQVVFARQIPRIVSDNAREDFEAFLSDNGLSLDDISAFLLHPGGTKVLEAYQRALGLNGDSLSTSRTVLREFGNMSSVTVLFVLERYLFGTGQTKSGNLLVSALGPGFCSETLLLRS